MRIDRGGYFDGNSIFVIIGFTSLIIMGLISLHSIFAILFLFYIPVLTTRSILEIDFENHKIGVYISIFGEKKKLKNKYDEIELLYINENRYKKQLQSRGTSVSTRYYMYSAYLKTSDGKKFLIAKDKVKGDVIDVLRSVSKKSGISIKDNTK